MSATNQTEWKCDRCGLVKVTRPDSKPFAWGHITTAFSGQAERKLDLCNPCNVSLRGEVEYGAAYRVANQFFHAAADYFGRPAGSAGNRDRGEAARTLLATLDAIENGDLIELDGELVAMADLEAQAHRVELTEPLPAPSRT